MGTAFGSKISINLVSLELKIKNNKIIKLNRTRFNDILSKSVNTASMIVSLHLINRSLNEITNLSTFYIRPWIDGTL